MTPPFTILGFAAKLAELSVKANAEARGALERAALVVEREAKDSVGKYQQQSGPFTAWAELADSTKEDRVKHGFSENEPELRTGALRDSIEHVVEDALGGGIAHVGSDSQVMEWQELGTSKMPPRSILGGAAVRKSDEVKEIIGDGVYGALIGKEVRNGAIPVIEST